MCLLRPNNLMSSINFMDFLRKFHSSLTRCSKFDGKLHLTAGRNTQSELRQSESLRDLRTQTLRKSFPLSQVQRFRLETPYNEQGHKATAERA